MLEAVAQYDFTARSSREVSFTKGATILLYCQASSDWWRGCVDGREGLVPDKYILIKIRLVLCVMTRINPTLLTGGRMIQETPWLAYQRGWIRGGFQARQTP